MNLVPVLVAVAEFAIEFIVRTLRAKLVIEGAFAFGASKAFFVENSTFCSHLFSLKHLNGKIFLNQNCILFKIIEKQFSLNHKNIPFLKVYFVSLYLK